MYAGFISVLVVLILMFLYAYLAITDPDSFDN
jgi:hypothetical protein